MSVTLYIDSGISLFEFKININVLINIQIYRNVIIYSMIDNRYLPILISR